MRKFIHTVTVTGADDSIRPESILGIAAEYPFVEFGLLSSAKSEGRPRFPSKLWLRKLRLLSAASDVKLKLSVHLCGDGVRQILQGIIPTSFYPFRWMVSRLQMNTHGMKHKVITGPLVKMMLEMEDVEFIFQYDNVNVEGLNASRSLKNVSALFDVSHGSGSLPKSWPGLLDGVRCGYAGGLSPENLAEEITKIEQVVPEGATIWIDAETHLRDNQDKFSPVLVRAFLEAAKPWVI